MLRSVLFLSVCLAGPSAAAQEVPGLRVSLTGRSIVPAHGRMEFRLLLTADKDTEVPAQLLNGTALSVKCDDAPRPAIRVEGKGGSVPLVAGTRIERMLAFPAAQFLPAPDHPALARVVVAWEGMAGTSFAFKVAPDTRNLQVSELDLAKTQVVLVTSHGDMRLSFRPDKAPRHVENFVKLCLQGFYDGTKFHRVMKNFMIQGGCPNTKDDTKPELWGAGGPGYSLDLEPSDLRHLPGTLSMARTSDPNTGGSGFFIVHKEAPHLDTKYSAFGNLEEGVDCLNSIAEVAVTGAQLYRPVVPVVLFSAIVIPVKK